MLKEQLKLEVISSQEYLDLFDEFKHSKPPLREVIEVTYTDGSTEQFLMWTNVSLLGEKTTCTTTI